MSDKNQNCIVVFETVIDGKVARAEIDATGQALHSRHYRRVCEDLARRKFAELSPAFDRRQRIEAVDIVTLKEPEH